MGGPYNDRMKVISSPPRKCAYSNAVKCPIVQLCLLIPIMHLFLFDVEPYIIFAQYIAGMGKIYLVMISDFNL